MKKLVLAVAAVAALGAFADIPARYRQLDWIESDGTQWVLTDFTPDSTQCIECGFRIPAQSANNSPRIYCSRGARDYADRAYALGFGASAGPKLGAFSAFNGEWGDLLGQDYKDFYKSDAYPVFNQDYEICFDTPNRKIHFLQDGEVFQTVATRGKVEFTGGSKLAIFCDHMLGEGLTKDSNVSKSIVRFYYLRVKDTGGNVLLDLVPVRDTLATTSSASVGLYDTVGGGFYGSCTGSRFIPSDGQTFTKTLNHGDYASDAEAGAALVAAAKTFGQDDVLVVGKGRWLLSAETGPVVLGTRAVLKGATDDPRDTVIDADGVTSGISIVNANNAVVSSLTVTNGLAVRTLAGDRAAGGVYASNARYLLVTNCVVTSCKGDFDGTEELSTWNYIYGAGIYASGTGLEIVDTLIENCRSTITKSVSCRNAVYGVGVHLADGTLRRCVVRDNKFVRPLADADWHSLEMNLWGVGVYMSGSAVVDSCAVYGNAGTNTVPGTAYPTIGASGGGVFLNSAGNVLKNSYVTENYGYLGAGVYQRGAGCRVEDCDLVRNRGQGIAFSRGGNLYVGGNGCKVIGCRLEEGYVTESATAAFFSGTGTCMSNCIVRGNNQGKSFLLAHGAGTTNTHSLICNNTGAYFYEGAGLGLTVTDCVFSNNVQSATFCGFAGMGTTINTDAQVKRVRNCLFVGNTMAGGTGRGVMKGTALVQFVWDSCTFVSNAMASSLYRFSHDGLSKTGTKGEGPLLAPCLITRNCLFWKNHTGNGRTAATIINDNFAGSPNSVSNNFIYGANADYVTKANGNIIDVEDPGFVDAANGDYRLTRKAAVREKAALSDWMGDGSRKSPRDLGKGFAVEEGTVTFTACGETHAVGCNLTKIGASPRVYGGLPDIGACEYFCPPGLLLLVK